MKKNMVHELNRYLQQPTVMGYSVQNENNAEFKGSSSYLEKNPDNYLEYRYLSNAI